MPSFIVAQNYRFVNRWNEYFLPFRKAADFSESQINLSSRSDGRLIIERARSGKGFCFLFLFELCCWIIRLLAAKPLLVKGQP